jgi:hypothetical protein
MTPAHAIAPALKANDMPGLAEEQLSNVVD